MEIREFQAQDEEAVVALWERCGLVQPWNDPRKDISRKLEVRPDLFLVGITDGRVVATVMAGYDGHRGWINYLAVAPEERRRGCGRTMMREAEDRLRTAGCPKIAGDRFGGATDTSLISCRTYRSENLPPDSLTSPWAFGLSP